MTPTGEDGQEHGGHAGSPQNGPIRRLEHDSEQLHGGHEAPYEEAKLLTEGHDKAERGSGPGTARLRSAGAQLTEQGTEVRDLRREHGVPAASLLDDLVARSESAESKEELRGVLEAMQVLARELKGDNSALSLANAELGQRLAARTTALTEANGAVQRSEEQLCLALTYAEAGAWELQATGDKAAWSKEWCLLHGLDPGCIASRRNTWTECVHLDDRPSVEAALQRCLKGAGEDLAVEYRRQHPRRGERWLAGRGRLLCDESGNPAQVSGLTFDVTARKAAELALAERNTLLEQEVEATVAARQAAQMQLFQTMKMDALEQLTGGVAHDFNNVLAVLISGMTLLLRAESEEQRDSLLQSMMQAARRGATLTRRLLSFARRQPLQAEPLELEPWLQEMHHLAAPVLRAGMRLVIEVEGDVGPVLIDRGELELAMLNLLVNARDAMPRGGRMALAARNVHLQASNDADGLDGDFVELRVIDEGEGMTAEVLPRIFEPFFTTKPVGQGAGLGLPQVYGFAHQSGGTVRVSSTPGKGTEVSLFLPCAQGAGQVSAAQPNEAPVAMREDQSLAILLVEDDEQVAVMTHGMLSALGHGVERVSSAEEALRALEEGRFDVLLTDVMLGGGPDGIELAVTASRLWPDLPVLLASGYGGIPERIAAAKLPLLRKPFGGEDLRQAIRAVCVRAGRPHPAGKAFLVKDRPRGGHMSRAAGPPPS